MKTAKANLVVIVAVVLALGAGVAGGVLWARSPGRVAAVPSKRVSGPSPLARELGLSAEQNDQMRLIWENVQKKGQKYFENARDLQGQREEEMISLLNEEQKAKFEAISKKYEQRFSRLVQERDQSFEDAIENTRRILTPPQREAYEHMIRRRIGPLPTTRPASAEDLLSPPVIPAKDRKTLD